MEGMSSRASAHRLATVLSLAVILLAFGGCASVPPEVVKVHQKERDILVSLQATHMAVVEYYFKQKEKEFDEFFFQKYGPDYLAQWKIQFKKDLGKDYDEGHDFPRLYEDLVARYMKEAKPLSACRDELREAVCTEYANALAAHDSVDRWLASLKKLDDAQKSSINEILNGFNAKFSVEDMQKALDEALTRAKAAADAAGLNQ